VWRDLHKPALLAIALVVTVSGTNASPPLARAQTSSAASAPALTSPRVIFAGTPAEIGLKYSWLGRVEPPGCIVFYVSVFPSGTSLHLTTSGLGRAKLAASPEGSCPSPCAAWREEIGLNAQAGLDRRGVALVLDPKVEPPIGGTLAGRVVAFNDQGELGATPLTVRPGGQSSFLQALQWCFGFGLPALLGYGLTQLALIVQARRQANDEFEKFRALDAMAIAEAIDALRTVLADKGMKRPGRIVYDKMKTTGVLEKLPAHKRRYFIDLCYRNKMEAIVALVRELFPVQATML